MADKPKILIVGGDSLVGRAVVAALKARGHNVLASTRRKDTLNPCRVFLDFESDPPFRAPGGIDCAMVVAAVTDNDRCERDPLARGINVELIPKLVRSLLEQGLFVTFISTNTVFGGDQLWPGEEDLHFPGYAYSRQKSEGEAAIREIAARLGATERINIVRLTKVLDAGVSPLPAWFSSWERGELIEPFEDLIFAPISGKFTGQALATIAEKRIPGNMHLSNAQNMNYVDFAHALAHRFDIAPDLIKPTTSVAKGISIVFQPRYSGLGMSRTTRLTGIEPQKIDQLVADVIADHQGV
jgi:dTDP-4-dehydrorhamnose reductase